MNVESIRAHCMGFPHATEQIQWGYDLVFKVAGKMFAVMPLEPAPVLLSFKCTEEKFAELLEIEGVIPAPYMARNKWVALQRFDALAGNEVAELLRCSYDLVFAKLPKRTQAELTAKSATKVSRKRLRGRKPARKSRVPSPE